MLIYTSHNFKTMTNFIDVDIEYDGRECMNNQSKMKVKIVDDVKRTISRSFEEVYGMLGYGMIDIDNKVYEIPAVEYYSNADIISTIFEFFKEYCITRFHLHVSIERYVSANITMHIGDNTAYISLYMKHGLVKSEVQYWNVDKKFEYKDMEIPTIRNLILHLKKELDKAIEDYNSVQNAFKTANEVSNSEIDEIVNKLKETEMKNYGEIEYHYMDNLGNLWVASKTPMEKEFYVKINGMKFGYAKDVNEIAKMIYSYIHGKGEKPMKVKNIVAEKKEENEWITLPRWYYDPKTMVEYDAYEIIKNKGYSSWIDVYNGTGKERHGAELIASREYNEEIAYNPKTKEVRIVKRNEVGEFVSDLNIVYNHIREMAKNVKTGEDYCKIDKYVDKELKALLNRLKKLNISDEEKRKISVIPDDIAEIINHAELRCVQKLAVEVKEHGRELAVKEENEKSKEVKPIAKGFEPEYCCGEITRWKKKYASYQSAKQSANRLEAKLGDEYNIKVYRGPTGKGYVEIEKKKGKEKEETAIPEEVLEFVKDYRKAEREIEEHYHIPFQDSELYKVRYVPKANELIKKYGESVVKRAFEQIKSEKREVSKGSSCDKFKEDLFKKYNKITVVARKGNVCVLIAKRLNEYVAFLFDGDSKFVITREGKNYKQLHDEFAKLKEYRDVYDKYKPFIIEFLDFTAKGEEEELKIPLKYHTKEEKETVMKKLVEEAEKAELEKIAEENERTLLLFADIVETKSGKMVHIWAYTVSEAMKSQKERKMLVDKYIPLTNGAYAKNYFWKIYRVFTNDEYNVVYNLHDNAYLEKLFKVKDMEKKLGITNVEEENVEKNVEENNVDYLLERLDSRDKICTYIRNNTTGEAGVKRYTGRIPFEKLMWKLQNMLRFYFTHDTSMTNEQFDEKYLIERFRVGNRNISSEERKQLYTIEEFADYMYNVCANGWDIDKVLTEYRVIERRKEVNMNVYCDALINRITQVHPVVLEEKVCNQQNQTFIWKFKFSTAIVSQLGVKGFVIRIENECYYNRDVCKSENCKDYIIDIELDERLMGGTLQSYKKMRICNKVERAYDIAMEMVNDYVNKVLKMKENLKVRTCVDVLKEFKSKKECESAIPIMQYPNGNCAILTIMKENKLGSQSNYCVHFYDMSRNKVFNIACATSYKVLYDELMKWKNNIGSFKYFESEYRDTIKYLQPLIAKSEVEESEFANYKSLVKKIENNLPLSLHDKYRTDKEIALTFLFSMPYSRENELKELMGYTGGIGIFVSVYCEAPTLCRYIVNLLTKGEKKGMSIASGDVHSVKEAYELIYKAISKYIEGVYAKMNKAKIEEQNRIMIEKTYTGAKKKGANIHKFVAFLKANKMQTLYNVNVRYELIEQSLFGTKVLKDESWTCRKVQFSIENESLKIDCDGDAHKSFAMLPSKITIDGHTIRIIKYEGSRTMTLSYMW